MPEGDTIYRTATVLRRALLNNMIQRARGEALDTGRLEGRRIIRVEPRGKHLLMHLDDGSAVHSHMGMTGSWHLYRPGQEWEKPERLADLVLRAAELDVVCFTPKQLEWLSADGLRRHRWLRMLGPDLLDPDFDLEEGMRRMRMHDARPLGEAVMDQSIVCGIGNIYKSEGLFVTRLSPFDLVGQFTDEQLRDLLEKTRKMMLRNRGGADRRIRVGRDGPVMWAYGRQNKPCLVCGGRIQLRRQGDLGRTTFWCPTCQPSVQADVELSGR